MAVQIDGSQGSVIATSGDYSGGVSIGGTLTYEDVTNIDAVGLITARSGIEIGASPGVGASISVDGNAILSGITTFKGTSNFGEHLLVDSGYLKLTSEADGAQIRVGAAQDFQVEHDGSNTYLGNTTGDLVFQNDANIKFTLKTGGTERVRIGAGGSVGIGLESPNSMLHVQGAEGRAQLTLGNTNAAASDGDFLAGIDFHIKDNNDATGSVCSAIRTYADQNHTATAKGTAIAFHTTDDDTTVLDERLRITHDGKVAIGNGSPQQLLHVWPDTVDTTTSYIRITAGDRNSNTGLDLGHDASGNGHVNMVSNGHLHFSTNNTERLRIMNDGRVGIKFTGNYTMNSSSTNLVIGDGGSGVGMTFWTAVGADNQTISFQSNESLSRAEGEISYGPSNTSTANDRHAMMFRTNSNERVRIASDGNVGIKVTDPQSNLHVYGPGDIRMGSGDTGVANIALQVEHADDYTGTHFMFEITDSACWTFNGSHIAHGGGGSSYGMNVTYIRAMAGREAGAADSGDTWRNGGHQVNNEVMTTGQIGLNPGAGSVSFATDDTPDGASSTRSLYKISFSAAGQGATTTWGKLQGVLTWASTSTNGIVKIKDKDGNVLWNSRP